MWHDYTAISTTSVPSERVFSEAGNLVTKKRTRMASETIKYVICLRAWGLIPEADDKKEVEIIDLTDEVGAINDIIERILHLHLPTLTEQQAKE